MPDRLQSIFTKLNNLKPKLDKCGRELNILKNQKEHAGLDLFRCENMNFGGRDWGQDNCDIEREELRHFEDLYYEKQAEYEKLRTQYEVLIRERDYIRNQVDNKATENDTGFTPKDSFFPDGTLPDESNSKNDNNLGKPLTSANEMGINIKVISGIVGLLAIGFALAFIIEKPILKK